MTKEAKAPTAEQIEWAREIQLHDALSQLVGWVEDGCQDDGRQYCLTEARAALKAFKIVRADIPPVEIRQLEWLAARGVPAWGGHLERGDPVTDPLMASMIDRGLIEISADRSGYIVGAAGRALLKRAKQ